MKYGSSRIFARMLFLCALFAFSSIVHFTARAASGLSITEIMYDPAGTDDKREWIEVCNAGSADIDMHGDYLLTDGVGSSKHSLVAQQASSVVPAGSCAIIVQDPAGFRGDYPSYAGIMFDSSWTGLTATAGKTIVLTDSQSSVLDQATYDPTIGGSNTGDSLQKNSSGVWLAAAPSPGVANADSAQSSVTDDSSATSADSGSAGSTDVSTAVDTSGSTSSSSDSSSGTATVLSGGSSTVATGSTATVPSQPTAPYGKLSVPARAVAGIPVTISGAAYGSSGATLVLGSGHFALGDGDFHDAFGASVFQYVYKYPGTYVVTFQYGLNPYGDGATVSLRSTIDVAAPSVSVTSVRGDGSIELQNSSTKEADISGWALAPGGQLSAAAFLIPAGTIVLPGKKIIFAAAVTGFSPIDAEKIAILLPSGLPAGTVADSAAIANPQPKTTVAATQKTAKKTASKKSSVAASSVSVDSDPLLAANAEGAILNDMESPDDGKRSLMLAIVGALAAVAAGVWAYRKFKVSKKVFELSQSMRSSPAYPDKEEMDPSEAEIRILEE